MNLTHFFVYSLLVGMAILGYRASCWLGNVSERLVRDLALSGMKSAAKTVLLLVGYDHTTYQKSRLTYWNRAGVRFTLFWGAVILWTFVLQTLKFGQKIQTVGPIWTLGVGAYLAYRIFLTLRSDEEATGSEQNTVSEDSIQSYDLDNQYPERRNVLYRQWDYLGEIFAA